MSHAQSAPLVADRGLSRPWILLYGSVLACGIVLACGLGGFGFPCPSGDDAMYKSPAAELAQHGRLAIPCALGFLPRADVTFACYPPLVPTAAGRLVRGFRRFVAVVAGL